MTILVAVLGVVAVAALWAYVAASPPEDSITRTRRAVEEYTEKRARQQERAAHDPDYAEALRQERLRELREEIRKGK